MEDQKVTVEEIKGLLAGDFRRFAEQMAAAMSQCGTTTARVKGPGMRWDADNAEAMLALAALDHSRLWTDYSFAGVGALDIEEVYQDVHKRFAIDPTRRYLYGFSMGGGGTWQIATRTPDRWAAIAIFAGGLWRMPKGMTLEENLSNTPVWVGCGEIDRLLAQNVAIHETLQKAGIDHEWHLPQRQP